MHGVQGASDPEYIEKMNTTKDQLANSQENIMNTTLFFVLAVLALLVIPCGHTFAEEMHKPLVRIAEIEIEQSQMESYKAAVKEQIETSIRTEPGVLVLYAVSIKDEPTHIRVFEIYANNDAYKSHLETEHFKKYKSTTRDMVKSLKLIDTDPILLGSKAQ